MKLTAPAVFFIKTYVGFNNWFMLQLKEEEVERVEDSQSSNYKPNIYQTKRGVINLWESHKDSQ